MGGLGTIITIIIIVAWVVKGLSSVAGNQEQSDKPRGRSLEEWDEIQAQRREAMADQSQVVPEMQAQASGPDPSQLTMAQRIELARRRAREQADSIGKDDTQSEVLERARAEKQAQQQRQLELRKRRAQFEQAAQEKAARQRDRLELQRRRLAEQQARENQLKQQHRRRSQQNRRTKQANAKRGIAGSPRENVIAQSMERIHTGHDHDGPVVTKIARQGTTASPRTVLGTLDRSALRRGFIMKELLDKPIALRDPQADLLL